MSTTPVATSLEVARLALGNHVFLVANVNTTSNAVSYSIQVSAPGGKNPGPLLHVAPADAQIIGLMATAMLSSKA